MDNATALKILQNYGAPPSPENISKVMSMATQDSELLGRSMGLQGGGDMAGPRADLILDKLATASERPVMGRSRQANYGEAPPEIRPDSMSNGAPQNGSAAAPRRGVAPNTEPPPGSMPSNVKVPITGDPKYTGPGDEVSAYPGGNITNDTAAPSTGLNLPTWLLAALGFGATGALASSARGRGAGAGGVQPNAQLEGPKPKTTIEGANPKQKRIGYEAKIADESAAKYPSGATELNASATSDEKRMIDEQRANEKKMAEADRRRQLQAEIDAENAAMDEGAKKAMPPKKAAPTDQSMLMDAVRNFQKSFRK